jgi:hypothetical protein
MTGFLQGEAAVAMALWIIALTVWILRWWRG